jgi:hypothetical protein
MVYFRQRVSGADAAFGDIVDALECRRLSQEKQKSNYPLSLIRVFSLFANSSAQLPQTITCRQPLTFLPKPLCNATEFL